LAEGISHAAHGIAASRRNRQPREAVLAYASEPDVVIGVEQRPRDPSAGKPGQPERS